MTWALVVWSVVAAWIGGLRWLRVAQREHYLPGVTRFAGVWWLVDWTNMGMFGVGLIGVVASFGSLAAGFVSVSVGAVGPIGLGLRGRTSRLAWTERLRRLAILSGVITTTVSVVGGLFGWIPVVAATPLLTPVLIDVSLRLLAPAERRRGGRWVAQAEETLRRVAPTVVAITGSYGKTSTKNLVVHLVDDDRAVVPSPASFNNRMGLARAINEHVTQGTEVFVAEMGTYGPGEIRALCEWIPPDVAVITAVGPVHLERMRTIDTVVAAKREILERAPVAVVSIDHPLLAAVAAEESSSRRIVTVSGTGADADVSCRPDGAVVVDGVPFARFDPSEAHPVNVAAAVAVARVLVVDGSAIIDRLGRVPPVAHRRSVGRSERGFAIVDDTFNANPEGARSAVDLLSGLTSDGGREVVVTPGMVELGTVQREANRQFVVDAVERGVTDLVVVGRTNRRALVAGAREAGLESVIVVDTRDDAVEWVRATLAHGDAVLYENDLPDHYP